MNEIAQLLSKKFNLSPEVSQQIVQFIAEHLKTKLPEGVTQHLEGILGAVDGAGSSGGEGMMDAVKNIASGLMGKS